MSAIWGFASQICENNMWDVLMYVQQCTAISSHFQSDAGLWFAEGIKFRPARILSCFFHILEDIPGRPNQMRRFPIDQHLISLGLDPRPAMLNVGVSPYGEILG